MTISFECSGVLLEELLLGVGTDVDALAVTIGSRPDFKETVPPGARCFAHFHEHGITALIRSSDRKLEQLYIKLADVTLPFLPRNIYSGRFKVNMGVLTSNETRIGLRHLSCLQFTDAGAGVVAFPSNHYAILLAGAEGGVDYISISWNNEEFRKLLGLNDSSS